VSRNIRTATILSLLGLLAACGPQGPAPVEVDLSGTNADATALIRDLRRAAAEAPGDPDKRGALGFALEANGFPRAAIRTYLQSEVLAPHDPRWSYLVAVLSAQLGELETALAAVDRSLVTDAGYLPAHLYRGAWLLDLGRIDEAKEVYERATRMQPDSRQAWYGLARAHLRRDESAPALEILGRLAREGGQDPYLQQLLGQAYRKSGDLDRARQALALGRGGKPPAWPDPRRERLADYSRGYGAEFRRGDAFLQAGLWQEAATTLEQLRERKPTDPDLLTNLALAYRNLGRVDESIRLLELGLEQHPDHVHLHVNLGAAYEQRGELERALQHLDRALEINPELGFVYQRKGVILLFRLRRIEPAVTALEAAVAHDSGESMAHVYLGIALVEAGRWREAAERLELGLSLDPANVDAMLAMTVVRMELGQLDRAESLLARVERLVPGAPPISRLRDQLARRRDEAQ
jgi:tetratricopeptide (TPR) repeat protein